MRAAGGYTSGLAASRRAGTFTSPSPKAVASADGAAPAPVVVGAAAAIGARVATVPALSMKRAGAAVTAAAATAGCAAGFLRGALCTGSCVAAPGAPSRDGRVRLRVDDDRDVDVVGGRDVTEGARRSQHAAEGHRRGGMNCRRYEQRPS